MDTIVPDEENIGSAAPDLSKPQLIGGLSAPKSILKIRSQCRQQENEKQCRICLDDA
jgi:hypothetical protein